MAKCYNAIRTKLPTTTIEVSVLQLFRQFTGRWCESLRQMQRLLSVTVAKSRHVIHENLFGREFGGLSSRRAETIQSKRGLYAGYGQTITANDIILRYFCYPVKAELEFDNLMCGIDRTSCATWFVMIFLPSIRIYFPLIIIMTQ